MNIVLKKVDIDHKPVLKNLLELYIYDFTDFGPYDVHEDGLYGYPHLDAYWSEEGRYPFIIYADGKIAGFVLVHKKVDTYSIAEFFVMKKYRRHGVGKIVALEVFSMFKGNWEVAEMKTNTPAQKFWRKVIHEFTEGSYEEIQKESWNGPIQAFQSK